MDARATIRYGYRRGGWQDLAASIPTRIRLCVQSGQLLVLPRPRRSFACAPGGGGNTFGDRHSYLLSATGNVPITADTKLECRKVLHVSPFCRVEGSYE